MRVGPLGTKEVIALGLLVVVAVAALSVTFFRDEDASQDNAAEQVQAERTAGLTPGADTPTPTPEPIDAAAPRGWQVTFHAITSTGNYIDDGFIAAETLDFQYDTVPFLTMNDNQWAMTAIGALRSDRKGAWQFSIEYQGAIKVYINDELVGEAQSDSVKTLDITGPETGQTAVLKVEARDTGGPFLVRWK